MAVTPAAERADSERAGAVALRLVSARQEARALPDFPGPLPPDLAAAYLCQERAISLWPDMIAGWKIGRLAPDQEKLFGEARLAGPIFHRGVRRSASDSVAFPVFSGGFAAVECEFVLRLGQDAPAGKENWTRDEAAELVADLHIGIETAGSPMAAINDLGATVIIADFGNNAGLILGPAVADWRARPLDSLSCSAAIDGQTCGTGTAASIPGGPLEALGFLLRHCAARNRPLKAGTLVSTGAVTGIHRIRAGQTASADFGRDGRILCHAVDAASQRP